MNYYAIPPIITDVLLFLIGLTIFVKNMKSRVNATFFALCLSMVLWLTNYCLMYCSTDPHVALSYARIGFIGIVFIPILAYQYIAEFLNIFNKHKYIIYTVYLLLIPSIVFSQSDYIYRGISLHFWGYYPVAGQFYILFLLMHAVIFTSIVILLLYHLRQSTMSAVKYQQLKYVFAAFLAGIFGLVDYLDKYPFFNIYPFGYICSLIFIAIIAIAIVKYRLMDIKIAITRASVLLLVYIPVLVLPFWFGYTTQMWPLALAFMGLLASFGPMMYSKLQKKAESILLAQQRRYQEVLLQASAGMVKEYDVERLIKVMVYIIKRAVRIRHVAAFLLDQGVYRIKASRDSRQDISSITYSEEHPLIQYMATSREPFTFEELPDEVRSTLKDDIEMNLVVPAFLDGKLIGFLMLDDKLDRKPYSQEDIDAFKTLINQFVMAVRLDELRTEIKRSERLKMMGEMSSILGHEIRNPLSAIKGAAFLLRHYLKKTPEAAAVLQRPVDIIDKEIESMRIIIDNTLDFTRSRKPILQRCDITEMIRMEMEIVQAHQNIEPRLLLEQAPLMVCIDAEEMKQVLRNLINNAVDSMKDKEKGILSVTVSTSSLEKKGEKIAAVAIEISDTGCGIPVDNLHKIFESFFSTKSKGTGLGLAVVKKIIEERHSGTISVSSTVGVGTIFRVVIPIENS